MQSERIRELHIAMVEELAKIAASSMKEEGLIQPQTTTEAIKLQDQFMGILDSWVKP